MKIRLSLRDKPTCAGRSTQLHGTLRTTRESPPYNREKLLIKADGINCRLISMHTGKPIDKQAIEKAARETGVVVTVEEHGASGGLGGAVAETICDCGICVAFKSIGLPNEYVHAVGSQEWLLKRYGYSPENIAATVKSLLKNKKKYFEKNQG